jgi:hypothetical protein
MSWKFFVGSCILAAGLLMKAGAPIVPLATGIAVAGIVTWRLRRRSSRFPR